MLPRRADMMRLILGETVIQKPNRTLRTGNSKNQVAYYQHKNYLASPPCRPSIKAIDHAHRRQRPVRQIIID
jgi:hypothetical protein